MNLTKIHKQAIVAAIVQDIPRPALRACEAQAQKIVDADIAENCPKLIAAAWKDKEARFYLDTTTRHAGQLLRPAVWGGYLGVSVTYPTQRGKQHHHLGGEHLERYTALVKAAIDEFTAVEEARTKLDGVLAAIRTRKTFIEKFPEFEKYAPAVDAKSSGLPALANVVADLSKLGWPDLNKVKSKTAV